MGNLAVALLTLGASFSSFLLMTEIFMIPAMGCDARLYAPLRQALGPEIKTQVWVGRAPVVADNVAAFLAQAPEKFLVLGTSFGGRLALEIALTSPARVQGLVVMGAGAGAAPDPLAAMARIAQIKTEGFTKAVADLADKVAYALGVRGPATRDQFITMAHSMGPQLMIAQTEALAKRRNLSECVAHITCPSLLIWGAEDALSPVAGGAFLAENIPCAGLHVLEGCGHFPALEQPEMTASLLTAWLRAQNFNP